MLGLDRIQEFLAANGVGAPRQFYVLVAQEEEEDDDDWCVVGGSVFSYVGRSNCGFSEYLVVEPSLRSQRLGRRLFDARKAVLDRDAIAHGHSACGGLFIEVDNPERTPGELLDAERATSIDPLRRLRIFDHLGFRRVDVAYIQPPLAESKELVDYLDLLFAAWDVKLARTQRIPSGWIFDTLEAIWSAWTPRQFTEHLANLRAQIATDEVRLVALGPE